MAGGTSGRVGAWLVKSAERERQRDRDGELENIWKPSRGVPFVFDGLIASRFFHRTMIGQNG